MEYKKIPTTPDVWAAIMHAHRVHMVVFGSFSAPSGDYFGNPDEGIMMTEYGFQDGDCPIIGAETRWSIDREEPNKRINEHHKYWLCSPIDDN